MTLKPSHGMQREKIRTTAWYPRNPKGVAFPNSLQIDAGFLQQGFAFASGLIKSTEVGHRNVLSLCLLHLPNCSHSALAGWNWMLRNMYVNGILYKHSFLSLFNNLLRKYRNILYSKPPVTSERNTYFSVADKTDTAGKFGLNQESH